MVENQKTTEFTQSRRTDTKWGWREATAVKWQHAILLKGTVGIGYISGIPAGWAALKIILAEMKLVSI